MSLNHHDPREALTPSQIEDLRLATAKMREVERRVGGLTASLDENGTGGL